MVAAIREVFANHSDYFRIECDGKLIGENVMCKTITLSNT